MNKNKLKAALEGMKIQDSANSAKLRESLTKIGITVISDSDFYLIKDSIAEPVNAVVFNHLDADEISAEELYQRLEEPVVVLGEILTATNVKNEKLTFVVIGEYNECEYLGIGQYSSGDIASAPMRYTKSRCRKASASEASHFKKQLADRGFILKFVDGNIDLFCLRAKGQKYYSVRVRFDASRYEIEENIEKHYHYDDAYYNAKNYFATIEEAKAAAETVLK
jgi:hypothetical protein